jgi:pimeloyl-ACP methyl ester carboxylesterase
MPGMAASPLIFEHIKLPSDKFTLHHMDWIMPRSRSETLYDYCYRLTDQIHHEHPVLIGVSFGGIVVQELAKMVNASKTIIISSTKTFKEFPRRMRFSKTTQAHKILPTSLMENFEMYAKFAMGIAPKKVEMYQKYLNMNNGLYLDWALNALINWDQEEPLENIIHIHGDKDPVFPIKYIGDCITVPDGTHVMIVNRFRWFNENLPEIIDN